MKIRNIFIKEKRAIVLLVGIGLGISTALAADSHRDVIKTTVIVAADSSLVTSLSGGRMHQNHEMSFNLAIHRLKDFLRVLA
ncbi:hypothetical protein [Erwinia billingiae]|uniref:hypothetical protein n=1 Tax=Erwinia billingiae TaxID=182337 RepID=UPI00224538CC|nr:hypothetical protein [Erwinia billingiae]MCX0499601.1 hypothetical protein [Erwinia billingiae]